MLTDKIGFAVIGWNRPVYLRQTLASLEAQTHLYDCAFHLWQDGAVNRFSHKLYAEPPAIAASVEAFEAANLPDKHVHVQTANVGTAINQFQAIEHMTANYEYVVMCEDDVVLSPHWLRLTRVLLEQIKDREDIFSFSLGFRRVCDKAETDQNLTKTKYGTPHWWCEAIVSERWQRARPHFLGYYDLVKNVDYRDRPIVRILELFGRKGWQQTATSQDGGKEMAVWAAGMRRLAAVVNRGISIGECGTHFFPGKFRKMKLHDQKPYIFDSDAELGGFELP